MIQFSNVVKKRDEMIVGPLNFTIPQGLMTLLLGKNSKGKSTTLKLISKVIAADEGIIDYTSIPEGFAYMLDTLPFNFTDSPYDVCSYLGSMYKTFNTLKVRDLLKEVGISYNKLFSQMSTGQKRLAYLCIVLGLESDVIILDEPTLNLDSNTTETLKNMIQNLLIDANKTVIIASNNIEDFESICDKVIYLKEGRVIIEGEPSEVINRYRLWSGKSKDVPDKVLNYWTENDLAYAVVDSYDINIEGLETVTLRNLILYLEKETYHEIIF